MPSNDADDASNGLESRVRTEFVDSVDGLTGIRQVKKQVEWYFDAYNSPDITPRVENVTASIVGAVPINATLHQVVQSLDEQEPAEEFREAFERGIQILYALTDCDRTVRYFTPVADEREGSMLVAVYEFPDSGSMVASRKRIFGGFSPVTVYQVHAPRDVDETITEITDGFQEVTEDQYHAERDC